MGIQYAKVQRHADGNKEQPEQQPLNGSIAISSSWRYSLSASSTPAIKVPSAIDSPSASINRADPRTNSSVAAVNTSLTPSWR